MDQSIHEIAGKLKVSFNSEVCAVIDQWSSYAVTVDEFRDAVLKRGVDYGKSHGVRAWIVDSSTAKGAFSPEIQVAIEQEVFPMFAKIGVKYFLTITSQSALTNLSIKTYTSKLGPNGISLVEVKSIADAVGWLSANA